MAPRDEILAALSGAGAKSAPKVAASTSGSKSSGSDARSSVLAALSGGGTSSSSSGVAKAQRSVDSVLAKLRGTEAEGKAEGIAGKVGLKLSPVMKVLEVLDLPRAAIVSGVAELVDQFDGGENTHGFIKGIKEHEGVGDLIADTNLPLNVKRALGFVGDVALDPLTYLAPEVKLAKGSSSVARSLLKEGAEQLGREGAEAAAAKVLRGGVGALSPEELGSIGARGGLFFNVPGTGRLGRALGLADEARQVQVLPASVTGAIGRPVRGALNAARDSKIGRSLGDKLGGADAPLNRAIRSGDARTAIPAFQIKQTRQLARGIVRATERRLVDSLRPLLAQVDPKDGQTLVRALEGDPAARAAMRGKWEPIRQWLDDVADEAGLPKLDDYFPHRRSKELREFLNPDGKVRGTGNQIPAEIRRELREAGDTFLGEPLQGSTRAELRESVERIAKEKFGDDYRKVFSDDPFEVLPLYARDAARKIGRKEALRMLEERGVLGRAAAQTDEVASPTPERSSGLVDVSQPEVARQFARDAEQFDHASAAVVSGDPVEQVQRLTASADGFVSDAPPLTVEDAPKQLGKLPPLAIQAPLEALHSFKGSMTPEDLADALVRVERLTTPEGWEGFLRGFDKVTNLLKAYQILTPGFHIRNFLGGMFNNALAGVEHGAYRRWLRVRTEFNKGRDLEDGLRRVAAKFGAEAAERMRTVVESGLLNAGQTAFEVADEFAGRARGNLNPLSQDFKLLRGSRRLGDTVENTLRGALAWDVLAKGGTADDMLEQVYKFHFDYTDLSQFERGVVKRVIPFYTWSRKNFPLQIEMMVRNPKMYTRYLHAKRNIERGTEEESIVPSYFGELLGIRLPFQIDGSQAYLTPDLPFRELSEFTDPEHWLASANVLLKTPLEMQQGKQFFKGIPLSDEYDVAPASWTRIPGLMPALDAVGWAVKNKNGEYAMKGRHAYAVEQYLPVLGRMRRLMPSEEKYQERALTSWLSMVTGTGVKVNSPNEQRNELYRRKDSLDKILADLEARGVIGS